jgi:DNA processing protein
VARRLGRELAERGVTVVSGLARGIDAAAHEGALEAGGRTVGVAGCGADFCYPAEHEPLYDSVSRSGAVVTEFPLGTRPSPENFPKRNRVISGMSLGVVVVEAGEKSGALITAHLALEQGREVFSVPGSIHSETSAGTHRLLKQGAKLVERVEDVLEELEGSLGPPVRPSSREPDAPAGWPALDPDEETIVGFLSEDPRHIDDLTVRAGLSASEMAGRLLQLELKGAIRRLAGHLYVRAARPVRRVVKNG